MENYFIHPSVKQTEINTLKKLVLPEILNLDFSQTELSSESFKNIFDDLNITYTNENEEPYNIVFVNGDSEWLYEISTKDCITIKASTPEGFFRGLQTVLKYNHKYGYLYEGELKDSPSLEERGFHLDCARKFFPKKWIMSLIKNLSWMGFNSLEIHFSENLGLRLDSGKYEHLLSEEFLSLSELNEILESAKEYYVSIVPSLDSPGHLKHILNKLPDYALEGSDFDALDISNNEALAFIEGFYNSYVDIFPNQKYFNLGADEFIDFETFDKFPQLEEYAKNTLKLENGSGYDTYIHYINTMSQYLESKGYIVRVWNDGLFRTNQNSLVTLSESVEVCYWTKYNRYMAPLEIFEDKNYTLINYHAENFYYTLHPEGGIKIIDPNLWYRTWNPREFSFNQIAKESTVVKGAYYSLWCDAPYLQTPEEIMSSLLTPLTAFAQIVWGNNSERGIEEFEKGNVWYELNK